MSGPPLELLFLLALPAGGKSEVRRYLAHLDAGKRRDELHLGEPVELDDYPYVHMMRRVDEELVKRGQPRVFFESAERSFHDPRDWGTLIALIDLDYADLIAGRRVAPASPAEWLLDRFDAARRKVGAPAPFEVKKARVAAAAGIATDAAELLMEKNRAVPDSLAGKTVVLEFSRGGSSGATLPLVAPRGYQYALGLFDDGILARAAILYVWVTPEESRRKNRARADPSQPGSILHHGVPEDVMRDEYGADDVEWLLARAKRPGTVRIDGARGAHDIPLVRFDNRGDRTSFLRGDPAKWPSKSVAALHGELSAALDELARLRRG